MRKRQDSASVRGMTGQTGLRERKKEATRQALHTALVRLAIEHGLENVTVENVADAAQVSRRTFSNYFANKEEALLYNHQRRMQRLLELVAQRPQDEAAWTALTRAAQEFAVELTEEKGWTSTVRLVNDNPALLHTHFATYTAAEDAVADMLAPRLSHSQQDGLWAQLVAARFLAAVRIATTRWLEQGDGPLSQVMDEALRLSVEPLM
jgi:AcrR family transcriptional regulator